MGGKRFGVGVAAGLLFGLAIIASSGGLASGSLGPFQLASSHQVNPSADTTSGQTLTTQTSVVTITTSVPPADVGAGNGSTVTTITTKMFVVTNSSNSGSSDLNPLPPAPSFSSGIQSIAHQAPVSNAVVLVPVLVAFLLGAVFYMATRTKEGAGAESS